MGVFCANGYGLESFTTSLHQAPAHDPADSERLLDQLADEAFAAHVSHLSADPALGARLVKAARRERKPERMMLLAVLEAWVAAGLGVPDGEQAARIGCLVALNNHADRAIEQTAASRDDQQLVNPRERLANLDPYAIGLLSRVFGFTGHSATVGAQSACSAAAVVQAVALLRAGMLDHCVVVAPPFFPSASFQEMLVNLGVVSTIPDAAPIRPFDASHAGTLVAPIAGAIVLSRNHEPRPDQVTIEGVGGCLHLSTGTEPDLAGEVNAMRAALTDAGLAPSQISYINAHATGAPQGDKVEAAAIAEVFAGVDPAPLVNGTKAIFGHGFNSAGLVGLIATAVQLRHGFRHATPGLTDPIADLAWAGRAAAPAPADIQRALCNTFSFFGINTSLVLAAAGIQGNLQEGSRTP